RPQGVFMAAGAGIASGRVLPAAEIVDVAPTLLHSLGLPVPADLEGRVVEGCYEAGVLARDPVVIGPDTVAPGRSEGARASRSGDDQDKVMAPLQALPHLD